jgi:DNA-binding transcriptional regulator YiaG
VWHCCFRRAPHLQRAHAARRAPGAPLGARLYAARRGTELTIEEAATAAGVDSEAVAEAEADRPVPADAAAALEALIAELGHR